MSFDEKTNILDMRGITNLTRKEGSETSATLVVLAGSQAGRLYQLDRDILIIGRGQDADIRIEDDGVSRRQAQVRKSGDDLVLTDLGSTNGTFCNGERVAEARLQDGDKIQVGTGTILRFSFQDSLEEEFQRRQYESVTRDALTGCYNKKYLEERFPGELAFADRHEKYLAVAMLDIDHFKQINDQFGHPSGDEVLRVLGGLLRDTVRLEDTVSRFGGEEFAFLMRENDEEHAMAAVERVRRRIAEHRFKFDNQIIRVTASLGLAVLAPGAEATMEQLIQAADRALYQAKNAGRNRCRLAPAFPLMP